jgi:hypothetical protein
MVEKYRMSAFCHSRKNQYYVRVFLNYVWGGHVALCAKRKKNMSQFLLFKYCTSSPKPPTATSTPPTTRLLPITAFARVICALFFSILAAEKSGYVKYADFFLCGGLDLGFILV